MINDRCDPDAYGFQNGAKIPFATDDFFAPAEMLLADTEPVFDPEAFTEFGKEMDGWETRRKRIAGHDWCIIKLGAACKVKGILADTAFFTGNYAPKISIQAAYLKPEGTIISCHVVQFTRIGNLSELLK